MTTPVGLSARLMKLQMHTSCGFLTLFSVYAPTMQATEDDKDSFYMLLESEIQIVSARDSLLVLGDFNARVGNDWRNWASCLGKEGVGKMNSNGQRVLELCASQQLCVTNTYFAGRSSHKTTWQHPRSRHWHQLDLVLSRRRLLKEVLHTRAIRSAVANTDHCLVLCKFRVSIKKIHQQKCVRRKRLDRSEMMDGESARQFLDAVKNPVDDAASDWDKLCTFVYDQVLKIFGSGRKQTNDWFDARTLLPLVEAKRAAYARFQAVPTRANRADLRAATLQLQRRTRQCANEHWLHLCEKIQAASDLGNLREMYAGIRTAVGPPRRKVAPLKDLDGNLLTDKTLQLNRWVEHYCALYSEAAAVDANALDQLQEFTTRLDLDARPTIDELKDAISNLSNGKATGSDGIPAELLKLLVAEGSPLLLRLHGLVLDFWERQEVPQSLKDAQFIQLYKRKGEMSDCNNYRGISLLSVFGKAVARILLKRLQVLGERVYPESQSGFRSNRSTIDMVFTLKQLQEKCREKKVPLYLAFVDLAKAFDSVSRAGLYEVLKKIGCPPTLLKLIKSFHDGMQACVSFDGDISASFAINRGVKQGCVLAPCLFNIYFSYVVQHAFHNNDSGVYLHTRFDGGLFNVQRFRAKSKIRKMTVTELLFADDAALVAHSADELQRLVSRLSASCSAFGLRISETKTVVMRQLINPAVEESQFTLHDETLKAVDEFCYLGTCVTSSVDLNTDINRRIGRAASCFGQLQKRVWQNNKLRLSTKMAVYKACVLSVLLYGAETWSAYATQVNRLNTFHLRNLRKILRISWHDKISNAEVLHRCGVDSMHTILTVRRLRWFGHVCRLDDGRLPKAVLFSEVTGGARSHGRPLLRYTDRIRDDLRHCGIASKGVETAATDRVQWRQRVRSGAAEAEEDWRARGQSRRKRKLRPD